MKFLIARKGQQYGPYPAESLAEMLRKGEVVPEDLMFVEGWSAWKSVADYLKAQIPSPPPIPTPPPLPRQQPPPLPVNRPSEPSSAGGGDAAVPPLLEGTSEVEQAVLQGGRFVIFQYCFSVLIMSFKRPSSVIFLRGDQDGFSHAFSNSLISLMAGWWGIPWGPIWTIATVIKNARGGTDVTQEVLAQKLGPGRAAQVMARRQAPSPRGNAMKYFRWGLIGAPVLLLLLITLLPFAAVLQEPAGNRHSASREPAAFEAANRQINVYRDGVAFGNSPRAIATAATFSASMKKMREVLFEGGKKSGVSLSDHQFLTYCELSDSQCAFIVHVPELRRFSSEAKESLGTLAWLTAQNALQEQGITNSEMRLAVGLRGIVLYDRVLLGSVPVTGEAAKNGLAETVVGSRPEQRLRPFFQSAPEVSPSGSDSQSQPDAPKP